jgi:hypothetical protein
MTRYFRESSEVADGLGLETIMNRTVHPPLVSHLQYEFEGWAGDCLGTGFPVFLVSESAMRGTRRAGLTGVRFARAAKTTPDDFEELQPGTQLPNFVGWPLSVSPGHRPCRKPPRPPPVLRDRGGARATQVVLVDSGTDVRVWDAFA